MRALAAVAASVAAAALFVLALAPVGASRLASAVITNTQRQTGGGSIDGAGATGAVRGDEDEDSDGLADALEDRLAERFAPIVYHGDTETSFPVRVDWWLARTHLGVVDVTAWRDRTRRVVTGPLRQDQLLDHAVPIRSAGGDLRSSGTRSRGKRVSFFLENVPREIRAGEKASPGDWITYVHSYRNESGGVTLQYWRAYAWNDARFLSFDVSHGGDWEGIAVHLDSRLQPSKVAFLEHSGIVYESAHVQWSGTHPLVWSEEGGHSSFPDARRMRSSKWIAQQTWTGGMVTGANGASLGPSGGLRNVGEKSRPRHGQVFVKYSGLWGSRRTLFFMSGYWGPAFNETGAQCADGTAAYAPGITYRAQSARCGRVFITAWCDGMSGETLNRSNECYAASDSF